MSKYLHEFWNKSEIDKHLVDNTFVPYSEEPTVLYLPSENKVQYDRGPYYKFFCVKFISSGTFDLQFNGAYSQNTRCAYKLNDDVWKNFPQSPLNVSEGDIIFLSGGLDYSTGQWKHFVFSGTATFEASGNIATICSLSHSHVSGGKLNEGYDFWNGYYFTTSPTAYRFRNNTSIVSAKDVIIMNPTGYLGGTPYNDCFGGCTNLVYGPTLIQEGDYSLNCARMFTGCSNLSYVKCLFTDLSKVNLTNWMYGVSETGTFVKYPGIDWLSGASGIPQGWTVVEATF